MHVIETLGVGGAEQLLTVVLPALQQRGTFVTVAVLRDPLTLRTLLEAAGITVTLLPAHHKWNLPAYALELTRLARSLRIDIIHAHLYFPAITVALAKAIRLTRAATVVTFHNLAYRKGANKDGIGLRLKRRLAASLYPKGFSKLLAVSEAVAMHYRDALGLKTIQVVHNAVDLQTIDRFSCGSTAGGAGIFRLVVAGRMVPEKGHSVFLQALALLHRKHNIRATLIGDGPLRRHLESEIERLELSESVTLTGTLSHDAMLEIMATAHAVVVPSVFEGFGLVAAEAMALSRPVVVTRVGGLTELVENGINGIVVPPADPRALATALQTLLESPAQCAALGAGARRRIEQSFALPPVIDALQQLYADLLQTNGGH